MSAPWSRGGFITIRSNTPPVPGIPCREKAKGKGVVRTTVSAHYRTLWDISSCRRDAANRLEIIGKCCVSRESLKTRPSSLKTRAGTSRANTPEWNHHPVRTQSREATVHLPVTFPPSATSTRGLDDQALLVVADRLILGEVEERGALFEQQVGGDRLVAEVEGDAIQSHEVTIAFTPERGIDACHSLAYCGMSGCGTAGIRSTFVGPTRRVPHCCPR